MKKVVLAVMMVFGAVYAHAQFTVFQSVEVPQTQSYSQSQGYGTPFTIFEPVYGTRQQQSPKPKMQEMTLTGYYKKGNDWYYTPIRVGVVGDEVRLLSVKTQYGWSSCGNRAVNVGAYDSEEIRDNFNYKASSYVCGTVYF